MSKSKKAAVKPSPRATLNALLDPRRKMYRGGGINILEGNGWCASKSFTTTQPLEHKYLDGITDSRVATIGFFRCEDFGFNGQVGFNMIMERVGGFPGHLGSVGVDILEQLLFEMLSEGKYPSEWSSLLPREPLVLIGTTHQTPKAAPLLAFYPQGTNDSQGRPTVWLERDLTLYGHGMKNYYYLFERTSI